MMVNEYGAEVNRQDSSGCTCLHLALCVPDLDGDTIKTLLKLGADKNIVDKEGGFGVVFESYHRPCKSPLALLTHAFTSINTPVHKVKPRYKRVVITRNGQRSCIIAWELPIIRVYRDDWMSLIGALIC